MPNASEDLKKEIHTILLNGAENALIKAAERRAAVRIEQIAATEQRTLVRCILVLVPG